MRHPFSFGRIAAAVAFGGFAITTVIAQTIPPASGPNGRPANASPPEATATSPGTTVGPNVTTTSPGSSGPGYGVSSPGTSPRPGTSVVDAERGSGPNADATSPGTAVVPADDGLPRRPLLRGSGVLPSTVVTPVTEPSTGTQPTPVTTSSPSVAPAPLPRAPATGVTTPGRTP